MACPGCLPADCPCVAVVVTETLAEVRGHITAMYAALVVSLSPDDHGQSMLGYARARVARPGAAARWEGIAVAIETADGVPDPMVLVIDGEDGSNDGQMRIMVDRALLPAVFHVDVKGYRCHWEQLHGNIGGAVLHEPGHVSTEDPAPVATELPEVPMPDHPVLDDDWSDPEIEDAMEEGPPQPVAGVDIDDDGLLVASGEE